MKGEIINLLKEKYPEFTSEQKEYVTAFCEMCESETSMLLVGDAKAGSGKSSTLIAAWDVYYTLCNRLPLKGTQIAFTMFNSLPAQEFREKAEKAGLPKSVVDKSVKTYHAFALQTVSMVASKGKRRGRSPVSVKLSKNKDLFSSMRYALSSEPFFSEPFFFSKGIAEKYQHLGITKVPPTKQIKHVAKVINKFASSDMPELDIDAVPYFFGFDECDQEEENEYRELILCYANIVWNKMVDWDDLTFPTTFDAILKSWFLYVAKGEIAFPGVGVVVIDEAQDSDPVLMTLALSALKQGSSLALVGDPFQSIYAFRGAVDSISKMTQFAKSENIPTRVVSLSKSFRFGQPIANIAAMAIGLIPSSSDDVIYGLESIDSQVQVGGTPPTSRYAVLCRTNAGIMAGMIQTLAKGKTPFFYIPGDLKKAKEKIKKDILEMMAAVLDLFLDKPPERRRQHPSVEFYNWGALKNNQEIAPNPDLARAITLVEKTPSDIVEKAIQDLLSLVQRVTSFDQVDVLYCTAHSTKGLQFPIVVIGDDFREAVVTHEDGGKEIVLTPQERNLWYVALTRAQNQLYVSSSMARAFMFMYGPNWLDAVNTQTAYVKKPLEEDRDLEENNGFQQPENSVLEDGSFCRDDLPHRQCGSSGSNSVGDGGFVYSVEDGILDSLGADWSRCSGDNISSALLGDGGDDGGNKTDVREESCIAELKTFKSESVVTSHRKEKRMLDLDDIDFGESSDLEKTPIASLVGQSSKGTTLDDAETFTRKYSDTLDFARNLESETLGYLGAEIADGEIILGEASPFAGHSGATIQVFGAYWELAQRYEELGNALNSMRAEYRSLFQRKQVGSAHRVLVKTNEIYTRLKKVFSARAPLRRAAASAPRHDQRKRPLIGKSILVNSVDSRIHRSHSTMPIGVLVGMYEGGYTEEDAESGVLPPQALIFRPSYQRSDQLYSKPGKTGEMVGRGKAQALLENAVSRKTSLGEIVLVEMLPNAYALLEGQQRLTTFTRFKNGQLPLEWHVDGKLTKVFYDQLDEKDQQHIMSSEVSVEFIRFAHDLPYQDREEIARESFIVINTSLLPLTPDEINVVRLRKEAREVISAIANSSDADAVLGTFKDERAKIRSFLIRVLVMAFSRHKIHNDLSSKIKEVVDPINDWDGIANHLRFVLKLCSECMAYMSAAGRFNSAVAETFMASFMAVLYKGLITQEDIMEKVSEIRVAHSYLLRQPEYGALTKEGVNNQGNIELFSEDGTWKGRYPMFAKEVLEEVLKIPFEDYYEGV